jgi:hypothetical protein
MQPRWIELLDDEDLAFLKRFVLASGSLKEVAAAYGISYPTVRLRLDRLIAKVQVFDSRQSMDEFERTIRGLHIDGKLDVQTMKTLLALHQREAPRRDRETTDEPQSNAASPTES